MTSMRIGKLEKEVANMRQESQELKELLKEKDEDLIALRLQVAHLGKVRAGSNGSFMYGVGTAAVRGMNRAQDSKEFIGYYENTGNVYDRGESKKGGPKVKDGDTVTLEIDTRSWRVSWLIEGRK
ncbi:unnamed protein product [Sphagnum balticum]